MISWPIFILVIFLEALLFTFFLIRKERGGYVKNKERVINSINKIRDELRTLEHRVKLNDKEK